MGTTLRLPAAACRSRLPRLALSMAGIATLLTLAAAAAGNAAAQTAADAVTLRAWVEPKEVTIGDPIRYTVEIAAPEGMEVLIPVLSGALGDFTIVDFGDTPARKENGRVVISRWYELTCFETGDHLVPKPAVQVRPPGEELKTVEGEEVLVGVKSLLSQAGGSADIRDVKPPEEVPFDWRPYGLAGVVFVLAAAFVWGFYRFVNRPRRQYVPPPRPAHEVALAALNKLRSLRLLEEGRFAEHYVDLSGIIRHYLEDGFTVRAPEMTTEEFLSAAASDRRLGAQQRRLLGDFLTQADLVKFARHLPTLQDTEAAFEAARRFVEETRPQSPAPGAEVEHAAA